MGPTSPPMKGDSSRTNPFPFRSQMHGSSAAEYQLDELDPRPDDSRLSFVENQQQARLRRPMANASYDEPWDSWHDRPEPASSPKKQRPSPMFQGPPPPISASNLITKASGPVRRSAGDVDGFRVYSPLVEQRHGVSLRGNPDSTWRGLQRQQAALEKHIQELLDLQAAALIRGSNGPVDRAPGAEADWHSDNGSSTPTGTLYSTLSSEPRVHKSLYIPHRSTPDGNVIPVRQPSRTRVMGLHTARQSLHESMADLVNLKREEHIHVNAALSARKFALERLDGLSSKRDSIRNELKALEQDEEEPLGQELRRLETEGKALDNEIRQMEEKLVDMRNRRRWLKGRIDDVKSKREAGLSGYRGALKDINVEVSALMLRPPVQPLDQEILGDSRKNTGKAISSAGGSEFLRLLPQRRTLEMAKAWWEAEVEVLEQQRSRIREEQVALEEGSVVWQEVVSLVSSFESSLRGLLEADTESAPLSLQPGEAASTQDPSPARSQLLRMDEVLEQLMQRMQAAEQKSWNLLICAIGAELEAFREARGVLKGLIHSFDVEAGAEGIVSKNERPAEESQRVAAHSVQEESDNEVPPDLLISRLDVADAQQPKSYTPDASTSKRRGSGNEVPPEFLAEHDDTTSMRA
ncbi:hypothetical protein HIM_05328 [Hirsutella minnesotensis 3608]|uniref:Autophagy-related protein 28 n=1 Tax=Hirsutella minnesotensis 3608 TaxID=1043627 RepID=A0A0F8A0K0_9HYPO|nr:hypothetical protein HIM_05328 [Hirsutella minnesotensis 3608]